jgi:hypothetical protein
MSSIALQPPGFAKDDMYVKLRIVSPFYKTLMDFFRREEVQFMINAGHVPVFQFSRMIIQKMPSSDYCFSTQTLSVVQGKSFISHIGYLYNDPSRGVIVHCNKERGVIREAFLPLESVSEFQLDHHEQKYDDEVLPDDDTSDVDEA